MAVFSFLQHTYINNTKDADDATQQWVSAAVGAAVGGSTGASVAKDGEQFNRQLHQREIEWINQNAQAFAQEQGISVEEARQQLAEQALRDVDAIWNMTLGEDNEAAQAFIAENVKGTTFENTYGEQQTLFSTQNGDFYDPSRYAADSLKADPALYQHAQQTAKERTGDLLNNPDKLKAAIEDKFDVSKEDLIQMGSDIIDEMADKGVVEIITERYTDPIIAGAQGIETYSSVDGTMKETFDGIYGEGAGTVIKDAAFPAAAAAVVIESYVNKDISIYDNFVADKIEQRMKGEGHGRADQDGARGEDTQVQEGGDGGVTPEPTETIREDGQPQDVSELTAREGEDRGDIGWDPGERDTTDGVPTVDEGVDGYQTARPDEGDVPGSGDIKLVQDENGVHPREAVDASTLKQKIAQVESNGDYTAKNPNSTAYGKYQFLEGTYQDAAKALGKTMEEIRTPEGQELAMSWLIKKNSAALKKNKLPIDAFTVYGAHQQGADGFNRIMRGVPTAKDIENMVNNTPNHARTGKPREDWINYWANRLSDKDGQAYKVKDIDASYRTDDIYAAIKDDPEVPGEVKEKYRVDNENALLDSMSESDGVIKVYEDTGFELKSYPKRMEALRALPDDTKVHSDPVKFGRVVDDEIIDTLGFDKERNTVREVSNSDIKHIIKEHGDPKTESKRGHLAVTLEDIAAYTDIVDKLDLRIITQGKNKERFVISAKQVNGHYTVVEEVSTKKNRLALKTMYKAVGKLKEDALRPRSGETLLSTSKNVIGSEPIEQMSTTRKASQGNSIAQEIKNVKTGRDLVTHRYYPTMVEQIKGEAKRRAEPNKRGNPAAKRAELEKRGWDKSEDRYKAEMQKFFKGDRETKQGGDFHTYNRSEIQKIESGKIDVPLAKKLKEDLKGFYENPRYAGDREAIDGGWKAFGSEVDTLRMLSEDERLGLIEGEGYTRAYDDAVRLEEISKAVDESMDRVAKLKEEIKQSDPEVDALYGKETGIKLSAAQEKAIASVKDPMKRTKNRREFELRELKQRFKRAKAGGNKGAITKASNNLKKWQDEFMADGKIKKLGEEC